MLRQLVIGLGEIGTPLRSLIGCDGFDTNGDLSSLGRSHISGHDVLHVCIPWSDDFVSTVSRYATQQNSDCLIVVHSTVPIGTTEKIRNAVHSPVQGRHATMAEDLKRYEKWFGGARANEAADLWPGETVCVESSRETEALKLLCLAKFGVANAMARLSEQVCIASGVLSDHEKLWDAMYNTHVPEALHRPTFEPDGKEIGGHCVVPGARLLARDFPHELLDGVMRYGPEPMTKVSPHAKIAPTAHIGEGTVVWQFATVLGNAKVGHSCSVGAGAEIGEGSTIGNRVRIGHGSFLPSHSSVGDDVFIGPNVTFTDDRYPVANNDSYTPEPPVIESGASIGAGAVILPGVRIGRNVTVGAGAVVLESVGPQLRIVGNPARVVS